MTISASELKVNDQIINTEGCEIKTDLPQGLILISTEPNVVRTVFGTGTIEGWRQSLDIGSSVYFNGFDMTDLFLAAAPTASNESPTDDNVSTSGNRPSFRALNTTMLTTASSSPGNPGGGRQRLRIPGITVGSSNQMTNQSAIGRSGVTVYGSAQSTISSAGDVSLTKRRSDNVTINISYTQGDNVVAAARTIDCSSGTNNSNARMTINGNKTAHTGRNASNNERPASLTGTTSSSNPADDAKPTNTTHSNFFPQHQSMTGLAAVCAQFTATNTEAQYSVQKSQLEIADKLNQLSYPKEFADAITKMTTLIVKLYENKTLDLNKAKNLMNLTLDLIDNPKTHNTFLAKAKNYQDVAGGKLSAYMMLVADWATKIVSVGYKGEAWIRQATKKLEQIETVEALARASETYSLTKN